MRSRSTFLLGVTCGVYLTLFFSAACRAGAADKPTTAPSSVAIAVAAGSSDKWPVVKIDDQTIASASALTELLKSKEAIAPDLRVVVHADAKLFFRELQPVLMGIARGGFMPQFALANNEVIGTGGKFRDEPDHGPPPSPPSRTSQPISLELRFTDKGEATEIRFPGAADPVAMGDKSRVAMKDLFDRTQKERAPSQKVQLLICPVAKTRAIDGVELYRDALHAGFDFIGFAAIQ